MNIESIKEYDKIKYVGRTRKVKVHQSTSWQGMKQIKHFATETLTHGKTYGVELTDRCYQDKGCVNVDLAGPNGGIILSSRKACGSCKQLPFDPEEWVLHKSGYDKRAKRDKSFVKRVFTSYRRKVATLKERLTERMETLDLASRLSFRRELSDRDGKIFDA